MDKKLKGKLGKFHDKLASYQAGKAMFFAKIFESLLDRADSCKKDGIDAIGGCLEVCENYLLDKLKDEFSDYFLESEQKIRNGKSFSLSTKTTFFLMERMLQTSELFSSMVSDCSDFSTKFYKNKGWDVLVQRLSPVLDIEECDPKQPQTSTLPTYAYFDSTEFFMCIFDADEKPKSSIIARKSCRAGVKRDFEIDLVSDEKCSQSFTVQSGFLEDSLTNSIVPKLLNLTKNVCEVILDEASVSYSEAHVSCVDDCKVHSLVVDNMLSCIDFFAEELGIKIIKMNTVFGKGESSLGSRLLQEVSSIEAHRMVADFCNSVNLAKGKGGQDDSSEYRNVKQKRFLEMLSKLMFVQYARVRAKTNFADGMLCLLKIVGLDMFDVSNILQDAEFIDTIQGAFGSVHKGKSNVISSLEEQYCLAEKLAEERWSKNDDRNHWEMARDLIKEICGPIEQAIREKFDEEYRLSHKKQMLGVDLNQKLSLEIKSIEEELQYKSANGTMSLKTLKGRLGVIAEKPEYNKYCPQGGRKKKKI